MYLEMLNVTLLCAGDIIVLILHALLGGGDVYRVMNLANNVEDLPDKVMDLLSTR